MQSGSKNLLNQQARQGGSCSARPIAHQHAPRKIHPSIIRSTSVTATNVIRHQSASASFTRRVTIALPTATIHTNGNPDRQGGSCSARSIAHQHAPRKTHRSIIRSTLVTATNVIRQQFAPASLTLRVTIAWPTATIHTNGNPNRQGGSCSARSIAHQHVPRKTHRSLIR